MHKSLPSGRYRRLPVVIATLGAAGSLAGAAAAALPSGCTQAGETVSCSVTFSSGSNAFAVPAGVTSIHVVAVGGMGGEPLSSPTPGGHGAVVSGDFQVSSGTTLYAVVGGNASGSAPGDGGGPGGTSRDSNDQFDTGGGGGGASDLRSSPSDLSSRLLVAAGGGGTGAPAFGIDFGPGGAGGAAGSNGAAPEPVTTGAPTAGGGSSATNGGGGGSGVVCPSLSPRLPSCTDALSGRAGGLGVGGAGGLGGFSQNCEGPLPFPCLPIGVVVNSFLLDGGGGGGGGGGLSGGGGGGGGLIQGGGGGGGSNLVPPGGTASVDTTGVPMVQISYELVPTSKSQCKNGGWRNYPQFNNQGDCVSFVENGK